MKYSELKTKKARIQHIREMLESNPAWALRGLVRIYERQTEDEQATQQTHENNGIGFSGIDSEILSSFAEQVKRGRRLSAKQIEILHKKMPKYARQLMNIADSEKRN
jgi:hypothetical protein